MNTTPTPTKNIRDRLGLPLLAILGLALLAVPRVILHDLHLIEEGTLINALFVWIPPIIWIIVMVTMRVRAPFLTLLTVGIFYGLFLATGHLLLWDQAFTAGGPQLGGNLSGLNPTIQTIIFKTFSTFSSVITGTLVGAVCGLVATGLHKLLGQPQASKNTPQEPHGPA